MGIFFNKNSQGGARVADCLPYQDLYEDGTVLCRDWGLMKVWHVQYPDTGMDESSAYDISSRIARTFQGHVDSIKELKIAYWFVMERVPMNIVADPLVSGCVNMSDADAEIENYRNNIFHDTTRNNVNMNYCCCKVEVKLDSDGITFKSRMKADEVFRAFETAMHTIGAAPRECTCISENPDENIMVFLKYMTGTELNSFKCPPQGMAGVSDFLSTKSLQKGKPMMLGDQYVQVLTINTFPTSTYPNMLMLLETLPFCFKWVTRWIPRNNFDSQDEAKKMRRQFKSGMKAWSTILYEQTSGQQSNTIEAQAATDVEDMEAVLQELTRGETIGEMTSVIVLHADTIESLRNMVSSVRKIVISCEFDVIEEDAASNFFAWKSSLPGDSSSNRRKPFVTATNISHIIPFTNMYHGSPTNYHLKRLTGVGWPHAIGRLVTNELYYLNLNGAKDDVGHTFIIGSTGGGKSILLSFMASQWMRYPGSRVILFDKDMSFANICRRTGGAIYVPTAEDSDLQFMPLSRIREKPGQAVNWLETVVASSNTSLTPDISEDLMAVCQMWDSSIPTLERFTIRLQGHNPSSKALPALRRILENEQLSKLFGGDSDSFNKDSFKRKTMIEMGALMRLGDEAVLPTLQFIFDRMDELFDFDPKPTLLVMDEAWVFLRHPIFRNKIKEWLKTLRKKNVFVVFALQNIGDIDDPEEFLTSCHTRIFLPNQECLDSGSESVRELYRKIGLKDNELMIIGRAEKKSQYYIQQPEGSALVNFCIDMYQLQRIARSGN